jgi:hypothetical protein
MNSSHFATGYTSTAMAQWFFFFFFQVVFSQLALVRPAYIVWLALIDVILALYNTREIYIEKG